MISTSDGECCPNKKGRHSNTASSIHNRMYVQHLSTGRPPLQPNSSLNTAPARPNAWLERVVLCTRLRKF